MNFEFVIIDGSRYRLLKKYRYLLYFLLLFLAFLIYKPRHYYNSDKKPFSASEKLGLNVDLLWFLFIFCGLITIIFYLYSKKFKCLGKLNIQENQIHLDINEQHQSILLSDIINLTIIRGATWHYAYQEDNYLVKINNWMEIQTNDNIYKYEFLIHSNNNNIEFERMIILLKQKVNSLTYKSI